LYRLIAPSGLVDRMSLLGLPLSISSEVRRSNDFFARAIWGGTGDVDASQIRNARLQGVATPVLRQLNA
jgi:hypothetical protein